MVEMVGGTCGWLRLSGHSATPLIWNDAGPPHGTYWFAVGGCARIDSIWVNMSNVGEVALPTL